MIPEVYDVDRVKKFVKHLVLASKRKVVREKTKAKVEKEISKVRKLSLERAPKVKLGKAWDKLEKSIRDLTSTQKTLVGVEQSNALMLKHMMNKIDRISTHGGDFSATKKTLAEQRLARLSDKMGLKFTDKDLELMEEGLERMRTPANASEIEAIEKQLAMLEKKHRRLKASGKHSPVALKKLENMISVSKRKLKSLK